MLVVCIRVEASSLINYTLFVILCLNVFCIHVFTNTKKANVTCHLKIHYYKCQSAGNSSFSQTTFKMGLNFSTGIIL